MASATVPCKGREALPDMAKQLLDTLPTDYI
jgi:hypothetical protein